MCGGQPGTTFPGSGAMSGAQNPPSMGGLPQFMSGINGQGGGPNMGMPPQGLQQGNVQQGPMQMPPQMGQFPPRQAGGPMGPPMTDPNSAGGFFGHQGGGMQGGLAQYIARLRGGRQ